MGGSRVTSIAQDLRGILSDLKVKTAADFTASCTIPLEDLKITVGDQFHVTTAMTPKSRRELVKLGVTASFGCREKTLLDPGVRNTWEFSREIVTLSGEKWSQSLKAELKKMSAQLGISSDNINFELHNLLYYEKGQFFAKHQDSEKKDQMIATLVVILPTTYGGGELVVSHKGMSASFKPNSWENSQALGVLFYTDCVHEIKRISSGYRLALTFNVIAAQEKLEPKRVLTGSLSPVLQKYFATPSVSSYSNRKKLKPLVFFLDHEYTQASLGWEGLKGQDREIVKTFLESEKELDLIFSLSLVDVKTTHDAHESGDDGSGYYERYSRKSSYRGRTSGDGSYEINDMVDIEYMFNHWIDRQGQTFSMKRFDPSNDCYFTHLDTNHFEPYETEFEGYMGNYGNTLDRWYHRCALVVWPQSMDLCFQFGISPDLAFKKLREAINSGEFRSWKHKEIYIEKLLQSVGHPSKSIPQDLADMAMELKDPELASMALQGHIHLLLQEESLKLLQSLQKTYGLDWLQNLFLGGPESSRKAWYKAPLYQGLFHLEEISRWSPELAQWIFDHELDEFAEVLTHKADASPLTIKQHQKEMMDKAALFAKNLAGDQRLFAMYGDKFLEQLRSYPKIFGSIELAQLVDRHPFLTPFLKDEVSRLLEIDTSRLKDVQHDWSLFEAATCSCEDCKKLNKFLSSGELSIQIFKLIKCRREHVSVELEKLAVPVTKVTLAEGSPHKLILTKEAVLKEQKAKLFGEISRWKAKLSSEASL